MNARQEALLERAVALLETLVRASNAPLPERRRMADVPDLVTADNASSARLERDRRDHERLDGLAPDSPESYRRQHERLREEFDRLKRDTVRYENAVVAEYGEDARFKLPWHWQREGEPR